MQRIVIIGNAGGGKSTLARAIARNRQLPHIEIDGLLWQDDWTPVPAEIFAGGHDRIIAGEAWIIDGLGRRESIAARIGRATSIILIDMPLWMHFWLAAERQTAWATGDLPFPPGGIATMPPTRALFETMWQVDRDWLPDLRRLCAAAEDEGKEVVRLSDVDAIDDYACIAGVATS